jgi:hypothetical protein
MMLWAYAKGKPHQLDDVALPASPVSVTQVNVTQFNLDYQSAFPPAFPRLAA